MNGHNDKTNVDLNYATIVTNLSKGQLDSLNVEDFIEQENINLGQHQSNKNKKELKLEERDKLIIWCRVLSKATTAKWGSFVQHWRK